MADYSRHQMVSLDPAAWPAVLAGADLPALNLWAAQGWPAMVRSSACDDPVGTVPVGIPLPPSFGRTRIALNFPAEAIIATAPPPLLRHAATVAPPDWQLLIAALLGVWPELRCFGSLAWQYCTGMDYVARESDIDLLLACPDAASADAAAAKLATFPATPRLDVELVFPANTAVQWREWLGGAEEVLVKSCNGAALVRRTDVFR